MEEEKIKEVEIDIIINSTEICGTVKVNTEDNTVDLGELSHGTEYARWRGIEFIKIDDILHCTALHMADIDNDVGGYEYCNATGYYVPEDSVVWSDNDQCFYSTELAVCFQDDWYYIGDCSQVRLRHSNGDIEDDCWVPDSWLRNRYMCYECSCILEDDEDYWGDDQCCYCHEENPHVIEGYSESHEHEPIFYGEYKGDFVGLGFELEVDTDCSVSDSKNNEVASGLCSYCDLEEEEMRYAHDGSLNYGFECISQPHTIKDFWDKQDKWRKMLMYLSNNGYKSHDPGTCGLHVHVSRGMFGRDRAEQDRAIAKIYTFFDENWDEIVKVSRRKSFHYCEKNVLRSEEYDDKTITLYDKWKKKSKYEGGHGVALNNSNSATFEYRLGRGTLNAWSFFSWIDFVITLTKNAKRITVDKVNTNDILSWLGGIKESTAKYIYKRGAWQKEMVALFPNIEWETDLTDNSN